ncbi:MAG: porin family protein [Timaviella obliquedivisa GSE-PSE-MK23-08B]|nr:porin family protein [Timaviella obliquedivisa GSE-PSE-MK23-08B]
MPMGLPIGLLALSTIATIVALFNASHASAQAAYGSYIGVGGSLGLTDGTEDVEPRRGGGVVAVRYNILELPISLRAQALVSDVTAIVPTVSYDIPLNWQTTAYIGAGVAIQNSDTSSSPVGNKTSFAIQPGIDYVVPNSDLVVFGNAVIAFDAYRDSGGTAAAIQGGLGWNFGQR